jgi:hypothetical protein
MCLPAKASRSPGLTAITAAIHSPICATTAPAQTAEMKGTARNNKRLRAVRGQLSRCTSLGSRPARLRPWATMPSISSFRTHTPLEFSVSIACGRCALARSARERVSRGSSFVLDDSALFCRFRNPIDPITQSDMKKARLSLYFNLRFTYSWFPRIRSYVLKSNRN